MNLQVVFSGNKPYVYSTLTVLLILFSLAELCSAKGNDRVRVLYKNQIVSQSSNSNSVFLKDRIYSGLVSKSGSYRQRRSMLPIVVNTWAFKAGAEKAWEVLQSNGSALDAIERGCSICEELQCDGTVGFGGSPDENGETTLDAMIMDGQTHSVGAVACLRRIKPAISVARKIMEHTKHTILAGDLATEFAKKVGFKEESLTTPVSEKMHEDWKRNSCQPNFWKNVSPDPTKSCGPYVLPSKISESVSSKESAGSAVKTDRYNHDTIGMVAVDFEGHIASGTSSNGARNKIPGRVGDAPIVGAGSYVDRDVGGAAATGDGDVMMRFLPSLLAVEQMRQGSTPEKAAEFAINRITSFYPSFSGALIAVNLNGKFGAACHNIIGGFPYSVRNAASGEVVVYNAKCI